MTELKSPAVVAGLPSQLLSRRPDVAEAEQQLIAANADITVARAALFPSIELTASGGYESSALSSLVSPANRIYALSGGLTQPIFHGGALRGELAYRKARYTELLTSYHKTVLTAFGNVESALVAARETAEQWQRQQDAVAKARRAYEFAQAQMSAGTVNVLTVLNTENALFSAQDTLVQVQYSHLQALVDLFTALGGGWQAGIGMMKRFSRIGKREVLAGARPDGAAADRLARPAAQAGGCGDAEGAAGDRGRYRRRHARGRADLSAGARHGAGVLYRDGDGARGRGTAEGRVHRRPERA